MTDLGRLRPIENDEVELMRTWRNHPNVRANMYTRHEISAPEHRAWWARVQSREDVAYFIYEFEGTASGIVGFTDIDRGSLCASWAFYAAPDAKKGTGSRMEYLALNHAFDALNLHKLHCEVLAFNEPVINLHRKFGFQVEGIFRQQHRMDDGRYVDIYRLGLLVEEWAAHRAVMMDKVALSLRGAVS